MLGAACASALLAAPAAPALAARPVQIGATAVPGELIVQFERGVSGSERADARRRAQVRAERAMLAPGQQVVSVESRGSARAALARLRRDPRVEYAQLNHIRHKRATSPDDPSFGLQWGLHNTGQAVNGFAGLVNADVDAPEAWDVTTGDSGVTIAVIDEGVAYDHPDLAANIWTNLDEPGTPGVDDDANGCVDDIRGCDFVERDGDPRDLGGHGTHVAGIAAAVGDNATGVAGVNWTATILPVRVLSDFGGTDADIADGFTYAARNGARVVNASLGGPGDAPAMRAAVSAAPDVLFVVAAGNAGQDNDAVGDFPCNFDLPNLICVAATDQEDQLAAFSNFGASTVDLGAPGASVLSTFIGSRAGVFADNLDAGPAAFETEWERDPITGWVYAEDVDVLGDGEATTGRYGPDSDLSLALPGASALDLTGLERCSLRFETFVDTGGDPGDVLAVEASTGGAWAPLGPPIGDTDNFVVGVERDLRADNRDNLRFRFRFLSDGDAVPGTVTGAFVDNVDAGCSSGTGYAFLDGTSMATPHVAGAAALVLSARPSLTSTQLRHVLLSSGDPLPTLAGRTVTGRRLDVNAALGAAADPPAPPPSPPSPPPPPPPAPPGPIGPRTTPDTTAPRASFALFRGQRLRTVLRRGLRGRLSCNESCAARIDLVVDGRAARRLGLTGGRRAVRIGRARLTLDEAGRRTVRIRLTRRARARLRGARSVPLRIQISAADPSGNRRGSSSRARLRR